MSIRQTILESIARTLWVTAWADEKEERGETQGWAGQDLFDLAPDAPEAADEMARGLVMRVEKHVGESVEGYFARAVFADARSFDASSFGPSVESLATTFGHYVAMQCMGHGVAWSDDHAMRLDLPRLAWSSPWGLDETNELLRELVK